MPPAVTAALLRGLREVADEERASSVHVLFCTEPEKRQLAEAGFAPRLSMQFHWHNRPEKPFTELRRFSGNVPVAEPQAGAQGASGGRRPRAHLSDRHRGRARAARLGGAAGVLRRERRAARRHHLSHRRLLRCRPGNAGAPVGGHPRLPRHHAGGRHHQLRKRPAPLRSLLGLPGRFSDAALRALLLPAHRPGHRARLHAVRSGRPGRPQAQARPRSVAHPQRALDTGSRPRRRHRRLRARGGPRDRGGGPRVRRPLALSVPATIPTARADPLTLPPLPRHSPPRRA